MPVATGSSPACLRSMRSAWILFAVLGLILSAGALPARAGYDWCSVDPTIMFDWRDGRTVDQEGGRLAHAMDIQVMVPTAVLTRLEEKTVGLSVTMPSDVNGTEVLNTSTPLFRVVTVLTHSSKVAASSDSFPIMLRLTMPAINVSYPVRLVVTNQNNEQPVAIKVAIVTRDGKIVAAIEEDGEIVKQPGVTARKTLTMSVKSADLRTFLVKDER